MLYTWNDFDPLLFQIPLEIIRRDLVQRATMVLWIVQFRQMLSFMVLKLRTAEPRTFKVNPQTLQTTFPSLVV